MYRIPSDMEPQNSLQFDSSINSLYSYINSKQDCERKTSEVVLEVRRRLFLLHDSLKQNHMYPRTKKFDQLLIKYVELEFEVLYCNNPQPPKEVEVVVELRVLRLLQVMLYETVLKNKSAINENTDAILKKTVLEILGQVKSTYLVEHKLVHNIINTLLTKVNLTNEVHASLAASNTSDYGTDDDSDSDEVFGATVHNNDGEETNLHTSNSMELSLTNNVPTIEFADDDDDTYMIYLEKKFENKRKFFNKNFDKTIAQENKSFKSKICEKTSSVKNKNEDAYILIPSDSDEDTLHPRCDYVSSSKKKRIYEKSKIAKDAKQNEKKSKGVVTFEIIDDDDDDSNGLNYMVYIQKEVETNKKLVQHNLNEITISDSEDETVPDESHNNHFNKDNAPNRSKKSKNSKHFLTTKQSNEAVGKGIDEAQNIVNNEKNDLYLNSSSSEETMNILEFTNELPVNISEDFKTNFLIDPTVVFEKSLIKLPEIPEIHSTSFNPQNANEKVDGTHAKHLELQQKLNTPGGPVLGEKLEDPNDVDDLLECRLNDSLLEEILFNDSYLLDESRKEFEDLECFLFDESLNCSFESDTAFEPEVSDENIKNVELLLNATQKSEETEQKRSSEAKRNVKLRPNIFKKRKRDRCKFARKLNGKSSLNNPLKDFTNSDNHEQRENVGSKLYDLELKDSGYCCRRENNFKSFCKNRVNNIRR